MKTCAAEDVYAAFFSGLHSLLRSKFTNCIALDNSHHNVTIAVSHKMYIVGDGDATASVFSLMRNYRHDRILVCRGKGLPSNHYEFSDLLFDIHAKKYPERVLRDWRAMRQFTEHGSTRITSVSSLWEIGDGNERAYFTALYDDQRMWVASYGVRQMLLSGISIVKALARHPNVELDLQDPNSFEELFRSIEYFGGIRKYENPLP